MFVEAFILEGFLDQQESAASQVASHYALTDTLTMIRTMLDLIKRLDL
jgi:hypothetical protein